jgi:hypothetical protein
MRGRRKNNSVLVTFLLVLIEWGIIVVLGEAHSSLSILCLKLVAEPHIPYQLYSCFCRKKEEEEEEEEE